MNWIPTDPGGMFALLVITAGTVVILGATIYALGWTFTRSVQAAKRPLCRFLHPWHSCCRRRSLLRRVEAWRQQRRLPSTDLAVADAVQHAPRDEAERWLLESLTPGQRRGYEGGFRRADKRQEQAQ